MSRRVYQQIRAGLEEALDTARTVYQCEDCSKVLSVAEFIERYCERCRCGVYVIATKEKAA